MNWETKYFVSIPFTSRTEDQVRPFTRSSSILHIREYNTRELYPREQQSMPSL